MAEKVYWYGDKPWMQNRVTWQAYTVAKINMECLTKGQFPNGQKLTAKDIEDCKMQVETGLEILKEYGITIEEPKPQGQLALF